MKTPQKSERPPCSVSSKVQKCKTFERRLLAPLLKSATHRTGFISPCAAILLQPRSERGLATVSVATDPDITRWCRLLDMQTIRVVNVTVPDFVLPDNVRWESRCKEALETPGSWGCQEHGISSAEESRRLEVEPAQESGHNQ